MAGSSENLFNLVDQLQHLESTVTNLIFEMAFKLSSLTSSNIFLMVENNLGRKYGGKPNLCSEFASTGLKPLQNDIVVEFDPSTGSVKEYPHRPNPPMMGHHNNIIADLENALFRHDVMTVKTTTTPPNNNKKRRHPTTARDSPISSGEKRRRQYNRSLNIAVDPNIAATDEAAILFGEGDIDSSSRLPKFEADNSFQQNPSHDDDDDVLIEEFTMDNSVPAPSLDAYSNMEMMEAHSNHFTAREMAVENAPVSPDVDFYFKSNEKVAALRTLTFDVAGVEVNALAPAFKIMTSVLYDVAKMASATSPSSDKRDPAARGHFDRHFDRIMTEFPQLRMLTDQGVKVKTAGFGSFVRSTMQKTFGKLLDKALHADARGSTENGLRSIEGSLKSPFAHDVNAC